MFRLLRRRRQRGESSALLMFGSFGLLMACAIVAIGVPSSIMRARAVANLPQYRAADLPALAVGSQGLFQARIPTDAPTNAHDLALAYLRRKLHPNNPIFDEPLAEGEQGPPRDWVTVEQLPTETIFELDDGTLVTILIPNNTLLDNAEAVQYADAAEEFEYESRGYRPGQTITIEGFWDGNNTINAARLFNGTQAAYVTHTRGAIGGMAFGAFSCAGIALLMMLAGLYLRVRGR